MANDTEVKKPVQDSISKVDNSVAVGENLGFQRKWWTFERTMWVVFSVIILCDIAGLFGRGPLAQATKKSGDGALDLKYERIERTSTPSTMTFHFGPEAIHDGHVQLHISQSIVKELGAQRISPQPAVSAIGDGGLTYTFPVVGPTGIVEFGLEPAIPGVYRFSASVVGGQGLQGRVVVMP